MTSNKQKMAPGGDSPPASSRRSLLTNLWIGLGFVALFEALGVVFAFLQPGKATHSTGTGESIIEAGSVDNFALESVTAFVRGKFYLARLQDGGFLALSRKCTHLGCTVPWDSDKNKFVCPCHASEFDIRGEVVSPPAPRALDLYPVVIENNIIKVDTSSQIKRSEFRATHVVYPQKA
jgi:nitrite reductase/ring-hydroxylating ferredoxin subunit